MPQFAYVGGARADAPGPGCRRRKVVRVRTGFTLTPVRQHDITPAEALISGCRSECAIEDQGYDARDSSTIGQQRAWWQ